MHPRSLINANLTHGSYPDTRRLWRRAVDLDRDSSLAALVPPRSSKAT